MLASIAREDRRISFAAVGVSAYILGVAVPLKWDYPLIILILFVFLSMVFDFHKTPSTRPGGLYFVLFFVVSFGLSTFVSINVERSLFFSASLLPAGLTYFLVAGTFQSLSQVRKLLCSFSAVSIVVSVMLMTQAFANPGATPSIWIADLASPILVVPNDLVFLAVVSPISMALFRCERDHLVRILAVVAILLSVIEIITYQSRTGIFTLLISTGVCAWFIRPRFALIGAALVIALGGLVDGLLGFPLLAKFGHIADTQLSLWLAAWAMFLDAPLLGHGPHSYGLLLQTYAENIPVPDLGALRYWSGPGM
jgi:O-antigen ligase